MPMIKMRYPIKTLVLDLKLDHLGYLHALHQEWGELLFRIWNNLLSFLVMTRAIQGKALIISMNQLFKIFKGTLDC